MIIIKTEKEIETLREGGKRLARILKAVAKEVRPGISAYELNKIAEAFIVKEKDFPAFKNYKPDLHTKPFPYTLCVSINEEVVHGMPFKNKILEEGDLVSLDLGLKHQGLFTDHAVTVPVGKISKEKKELIDVTKKALDIGIRAAKGGARVGDIGAAIEEYIRLSHFGIVRELAGHGVGRAIHEDPYIPNYGKRGTGAELKPGMVIAIEPMITLGSRAIRVLSDGYTVVTKDHSPAAHFEHTVLITTKGAEILTKI